ncbi:2-oxoglutarate dehydrogenase complex [Commensalibacter communis]|uniref:2-oxoglutarate dehydrogenase E1 component n=1 Tax=Commensalibacter communis TaxID=2972786 RepID=A0A9W4TPF9_9PROT|nr:2-oxoglutarate dehydrogenase E1 component [Commensalibacter communis]CAI3938700.1 2-oxoglutarate dehydrogenase complex [Commensalibacter communis]CAI3941652.1 2-oxoglutarate dehydrogenase complex [Commensalibacter communis]CAI3941837.1 2-oxoglutarate dehydrogenase complex [Commensalibacter communis]CAI3947959.1 2-oxoglutarate dehydrogenase complex [Commensalibacter communis]
MAINDHIASVFSGSNSAYLADLYAQWVENPESVDSSFSELFTALNDARHIVAKDARGASWAPRPLTDIVIETDEKTPSPSKGDKISKEQLYSAANDSIRAIQLINAYRTLGHQYAQLDPLQLSHRILVAELDPETYGFTAQDIDRPIFIGKNIASFLPQEIHSIREIIAGLHKVYCRSIAWEYMYLQDNKQRQWLMQKIENLNTVSLQNDDKKRLLQQLTEAVGFEAFCSKRYVGVKRFGLDGGEVTIPALHAVIRHAVTQYDVKSISMGMAHRGRLNVLTNVVGKPFVALFHEFAGGSYKPDGIPGAADVKYHLGYRKQVEVEGKSVELSMAFNPSHLEAVGAVVEGQVRAEQDRDGQKHLAVLLHGDAAFAGQGVVYEILAMSQLPAYETGGTIHIVTNNQIGFTTSPDLAFSGYYGTDVAKVARAPIVHVNGDDPEAVVKVMQLAVEFREQFATDIVVDLVCYRRNGHNETDEPAFTQPLMYNVIRKHDTIYKIYADKLANEGVITSGESEAHWNTFQEYLQASYNASQDFRVNTMEWVNADWHQMKLRGQERQEAITAISMGVAQKVGKALSSYADGFNCHPKLTRQLEAKAQMFSSGENIDWATGEALAFGSLLLENYPVRLSGQDCQRGTFSHRNAVLFDQKTQQPYVLLNHIQPEQAKIDIYNSFLSEFAVLGFEYGYSCTNLNALVLWEAQFGDFANGAQIIIDQFISAGESKWLQMSGLVMLLPHSQEGQGAEHSSARLERFLQLCADENMQVCNLTTPANYFHALRRQLKRNYRQPLVIMSPKSLLRHKLAQSPLSAFIDETKFLPVIDEVDSAVIKEKIKRVVLCSGKVYYDLWARRLELRCELQSEQVALVRMEQLYPFPAQELSTILSQYPNAEIIWCQEEPENMGAWNFVDRKIEKCLREIKHSNPFVQYAGRLAAASPASGLSSVYKSEQEGLVDQALGHKKA